MIATYGCLLLILLASLLLGRALLTLFGDRRPTWLAGAVGFAALVTITPFIIRLPGRAATAAVLLALALVAALIHLRGLGLGRGGGAEERAAVSPPDNPQHGREDGAMHGRESLAGGDAGARSRVPHLVAIATVLIVVTAASLPFIANERLGILGEGIYTNDHAAQLYWADWLQNGFGPEPNAVQFGYPVGPQSVAAVAAEATGADLVEAFNGLLLAIPALTALAALAALGGLPPGRRIAAASLVAIPYLAVSFLAQSAFKETAMALFVLAFAIVLGRLGRPGERRPAALVLALLAAASVLTFSLPGLAWFAIALPAWLALELASGRLPLPLGDARAAIAGHRTATIATSVAVAALIAVVVGPTAAFIDRVGEVQASAGRLGSPIFPGEALGVWPQGDFRIVRGDVSGAIPATLLGLAAVGFGGLVLLRRRDWAPLAMLAAGAVVYVGARLVAEIHVEAKALAVIAPLVVLVALGALFAPAEPGEDRRLRVGRYALGALFALGLAASSFLALRAAPVGFDDRAEGLERLGERIDGESVAFLGVDRFAAYRLRGTEIRSPGGYVPPDVGARGREKNWQQGQPLDFDTLDPRKLDQFDYAITTDTAYGSTPPPSMERVAEDDGYVLWERVRATPRSRVLEEEDGSSGAVLDCAGSAEHRKLSRRAGRATVIGHPLVAGADGWSRPSERGTVAAGQESGYSAPVGAARSVDLPEGEWQLSLQYASELPLTVEAGGDRFALPPTLGGMYFSAPGGSAFWDVGTIEVDGDEPMAVEVTSGEPSELQDALGVDPQVWLGALALAPESAPEVVPMGDACGRYVDRFTLRKRGEG